MIANSEKLIMECQILSHFCETTVSWLERHLFSLWGQCTSKWQQPGSSIEPLFSGALSAFKTVLEKLLVFRRKQKPSQMQLGDITV